MERLCESPRLVVEGSPDPGDLATLEERVADAAMAAAGVDEEQEFAIFLRGDAGEILAGISGMVLGGGCELQAMWVDESLRRRGIAGALLTAAEAEARGRGCTVVMFHAYDVLTHRFYERLGYRSVGVLEDCLAGGALRWYAKDLRVVPLTGALTPRKSRDRTPRG